MVYLDELEKEYDDPIKHFKDVARKMTEKENAIKKVTLSFNMDEQLAQGTDDRKNLGYTAILKQYYEIELDRFFNNEARHKGFQFNTNSIMSLLLVSRMLSPGSKKKAFEEKGRYFERFNFSLEDIYRSLSHFSKIAKETQQHIHEQITQKYGRDMKTIYYDVTNFYFEIDKEDDLRKKGLCKEHRPNPIVQMGLAMDADGIPIAYEQFPGNTLDKETFRSLVGEVRRNYGTGRIIVVADKGLITGDNIYYLVGNKPEKPLNGYVFSFSVRGGTDDSEIIDSIKEPETSGQDIDIEAVANEAFQAFKKSFDTIYGGFGTAPKFPTPHNLLFLLRYWKSTSVEMVKKTMESMQRGGINDHIGGGFCRYSTDKKWLVPHFEKMLYDNALLAIAYLETFQVTKNSKYSVVAENILNYVMRDMTSAGGGFYSAEDADSEGVEGKFYVWAADEVKNVLGQADGEKYCSYYDITKDGNFEGSNIPNLIKYEIEEEDQDFIKECNKKLFNYRERRIHPYKDDKILTSWNGLMIAAMAMGGRILGNHKFTAAAEKAVQFIESELIRNDGRLMARYRDGDVAYPAYADDYAFLIWGLIELYQTVFKPKYLKMALKLNDDLLRLFLDNEKGGLYLYGNDGEQLIVRPKEIYDGATPSGNSVSAYNMFRLSRLTGRSELEDIAQKILNSFGGYISRYPQGHSFSLIALLFAQAATREVVLVGDPKSKEMAEMIAVIQKEFRPYTLTLVYSEEYKEISEVAPFVKDYKTVNNTATAYVCENFACQAPVTGAEALRELLEGK